jgi:hypothetical protein
LLLVAAGYCVFAIDGGAGTRNELKFAKAYKKRVFGLHAPPQPEDHDVAAEGDIWTTPGSGFTSYANLNLAWNSFIAFLAAQ